jgi:O-antigen ligase
MAYSLSWLALAFAVPLPDKLLSPVLSLCMIFMLLFLLSNGIKIQGSRQRNAGIIVFILFSLAGLASLLYSEEPHRGLQLFARRIVILLVPLFLLFTSTQRMKKKMLLSFILGNYAFILFLIASFLLSYFSSDQISLVSDKRLLFKEMLIRYKHPSYLGLNLSLCLISIAYLVKEVQGYRAHIWLGASVLTGFLVVYLSYARMGFLVYSITTFYVYFMILYRQNKIITWIATTTVIAAFCLIAIMNNSKFTSILQSGDVAQANQADFIGYSHRISIWEKAVELIFKRPVLGYGLGNTVNTLNWSFEGSKYNAHNQFLELLLDGGFLSLLLFLGPLLSLALWWTPPPRRWFSMGVMGIIFLMMLTESILSRIAGISSFALFLLILSGEENGVDRTVKFLPLPAVSFTLMTGMLFSLGVVLFASSFNPANPKTFGDRVSKIVSYKDLPGEIPRSLPEETKGYLLDRETNASSWDGNAYAYTSFHEFNSTGNEVSKASVYCYVSENFNGNWVRLSAEGPETDNRTSFYNLEQKGTWQKLEIQPEPVEGYIFFMLYMAKYNDESFDSLDGYVIFANPRFEIKRLR